MSGLRAKIANFSYSSCFAERRETRQRNSTASRWRDGTPVAGAAAADGASSAEWAEGGVNRRRTAASRLDRESLGATLVRMRRGLKDGCCCQRVDLKKTIKSGPVIRPLDNNSNPLSGQSLLPDNGFGK